MSKKIVTITTGKGFEFKQFGIVAVPGVNMIEMDVEKAEKLEKIVEKNAFFKREAKRKGGISIEFREMTQEEIDEKFKEIKENIDTEGKHSDLASVGIEELKNIYKETTGKEAGKKGAKTLRKEIIQAREEKEAADKGKTPGENEGSGEGENE